MLAPTKVIIVSYRLVAHVDLFDLDSYAASKQDFFCFIDTRAH